MPRETLDTFDAMLNRAQRSPTPPPVERNPNAQPDQTRGDADVTRGPVPAPIQDESPEWPGSVEEQS
jgi:hypothetical protein